MPSKPPPGISAVRFTFFHPFRKGLRAMLELVKNLTTVVTTLIAQNRALKARIAEQDASIAELRKLLADAQAAVDDGALDPSANK